MNSTIAAAVPSQHLARLRLAHGLPTGLAPAQLGAALGSALPDALLARLLASRRIEARLAALLARRRRLPAWSEAALPRPIMAAALLAAAEPERLAGLVGAVFHGRAIARVILASERRALAEALGPEAHALAVRHATLAAPAAEGVETLADLLAAARQDGQACLAAWVETLPPVLAERLVWRLPRAAAILPLHATLGPPIVAALAADLTERAEAAADG